MTGIRRSSRDRLISMTSYGTLGQPSDVLAGEPVALAGGLVRIDPAEAAR